jgi:diguanylate cyclase (GGDEF)-like protein/PAS domain S-box-containing protein
MTETAATQSQDGLLRDRRRARRESLAIGLFALCAVGLGIAGLWLTSAATLRQTYLTYLKGAANAVASKVDPVLHEQLRTATAPDPGTYARAIAPLRALRNATPGVIGIYTVVRDGGTLRFVLDAGGSGGAPAAPGGAVATWQPWPELQRRLQKAFDGPEGAGHAVSTLTPYGDEWGVYMSGWAPIRGADGRQVGVVGIDVDVSTHLTRIKAARRAALLGVIPAVLMVILLCVLYYGVRFRGLLATARAAAAAAAAEQSSRVLAQERQRLHNVLDGTRVSTWEAQVQTGEIRVDPRYAEMMGRRIEDIMPMTSESWLKLLHPDDRDIANKVIQECFAQPGNIFEIDFRMQHAQGHWVWIRTRGTVIERDAQQRAVRMVGTHADVSDAKEVELALKSSESKFRSLFELSPVGIALNDRETGRFLQVNDALVGPTGFTREELLGFNCWDLTVPQGVPGKRQGMAGFAPDGRYGPLEREYVRKDGTTYPVLLFGMLMKDANGREVVWSIVQDISQRKAMESELSAAALRDRLTGLANRTLFMERLQAAIGRVRAGSQKMFGVLFLDFDRFKLVNDAMGHEAGDQLLNAIALRLRAALRSSDELEDEVGGNLIARFGGDEFLILINDLREARDVERIARRLLASLAPAYTINGRDVHSTASIGIVTSVQCIESAEAVVRNADVAMYEAKRAGRACSVVFNEAMHTRLARHVNIESALRKALGTSELYVVYQPIIELATGRMTSVEALVRWEHPTLGTVSPVEFIPVAEESGLIVPLGQWVLNEACRMLARWREQDPDGAPEYVSVNISRAELALGERLLARIRQTLAQTGMPADCLQLEVTEREVMRDPDATLALMHRLRDLGVRLAMDDFGTGTSSLACLRQYPFDVIKIDRSFVSDLAADPDVLAVIHATITLVENLGKASVAEGVEEPAQVAVLQSLGCRYAQGYYFSRPVPAESLMGTMIVRQLAM